MTRIWALACLSTLAAGCAREADVGGHDVQPRRSAAAAIMQEPDAQLLPAAVERPPVLLPSDPSLRSRAQVIPTGPGHTATVDLQGASLQITGMPGGSGGRALVVQRTEYGIDASFSRDGGVYSLTLTCEARADARCANERYIRTLASELTPR